MRAWGPACCHKLGDGRFNVGAGGEEGAADLFVAEAIAVDEDLRFELDQRLELDLPLVVGMEAGLGEHVEDALRRAPFDEQLGITAVIGDAVAAGGGHDDRPALAHDARGGAHALDRLVEALVERVAAVGGNDNVERLLDADHGMGAHVFAARLMGGEHVTGEDGRDLLALVEGHIEQERGLGHQRRFAHLLPDRVALRRCPRSPAGGRSVHGRGW